MLFDTTAQITLFSLILMRMSGFILLNPILGRRNIPMQVKAGFIFILTVTVYSFSTGDAFDITNPLEYGLLLFKEFAAGICNRIIFLCDHICRICNGFSDGNVDVNGI